MAKKVLVRAYTAKNLGDDLFLKILFERYCQTEFLLIAPKSYLDVISPFENVKLIAPPTSTFKECIINKVNRQFSKRLVEIRHYKVWEIFLRKTVLEIDAYLVIGGSIFMQHDGEFSIGDKIFTLTVQIFANIPKFILGANFGPFTSQSYFEYYKTIFKEYRDICFRERFSKELFASFANVRYKPDIVFNLNLSQIDVKGRNVGFSLIDLSNRPNLKKYAKIYFETIQKLIIAYIDLGYSIYLFSFCQAEGDERCILKVIENLPNQCQPKVKTIFYNGNYDTFLKVFGNMEIMISSRFHALILSLLNKQNIYPIIYSDKTLNVLDDLNYEGTYSRIENLWQLNIEVVISEIKTNFISIDNMTEKAKEQFLKLDEILN